MKRSILLLCLILAATSCRSLRHSEEQRAIQAAKNMFVEAAKESANSEEELEALKMLKCFTFSTHKGYAVVTTWTPEEIKIVEMDNCGNPLDSEWSHLIAKPLTTPVADKYEMRRIAQRLWTDAGNTKKVPCYTVPTSKGWLAIFGGYCQAITVLVDAEGKVYDTTWAE